MKLIQLETPALLKGSWVWLTSNGLELEPIFSSAEDALRWYDNLIQNTELKNGKGSIEQ